MVLFHDVVCEWTQVSYVDDNHEWVILDSGSDVSLIPARYQADENSTLALGIGSMAELSRRIFADSWNEEG